MAISAPVALLTISGAALAAAYRTGRYEAGAQSGFAAPGVRIDIASGSFNVERILMHETCTAAGQPAFHDLGGFEQGAAATLSGTISSRGKLQGIYNDGHGGFTRVTGHISGPRLTLSGREFSFYTPPGATIQYSCHASGKFHPKRV